MCQFDAELMLLRHEKVHLDWQLKQADLRKLILYQELVLLKAFERREDSLQERLNECVREENSITVAWHPLFTRSIYVNPIWLSVVLQLK